MESTTLFALTAAVLFVGGIIKGIMGLGLPTITVGVLGIIMAPMQAAALAVVPTFLTNVWQAVAGPALGVILSRMWPMLAAMFVGTFVGGELAARADPNVGKSWLGLALAVYALLGLLNVTFRVRPGDERWLNVPIGLATGLANGATGLFVVPGAPYTQALGFPKDELVQALGVGALTASCALGLVLWRNGGFNPGIASLSAVALVPAFLGMMIGQKIRAVISQDVFRRIFFIALLALGTYLASRILR